MVGRNLAKQGKNQTMLIQKTGEKKWKIKIILNRFVEVLNKSWFNFSLQEFEAEEGVQFVESPPIGNKQICILRLNEENKNLLIQESRTVGSESDLTVITRELIGDQLVMVSYILVIIVCDCIFYN